MSKTWKDTDELLDRAIESARQDTPDCTEAAARVWANLERIASQAPAESIRGCEGIRALLRDYRSGTLPEARELLVQDHLHECPACRRASEGGSFGALLPWRQVFEEQTGGGHRYYRYAAAAALLVGLGLSMYALRGYFLPAPEGWRAVVEASDGPLYVSSPEGQRRIEAGGEIGEREWVRTSLEHPAVLRLRDGSLVEMKGQSELGVSMNYRDTTVHLERGSIIVEAAKRSRGHLSVAARDMTAMVTGTVFSVNRGTKGSRVSVIEGSVRVSGPGGGQLLAAGQQASSNPYVQTTSIQSEIDWSRKLDEYLGMLGTLANVSRQLETVRWPGLRYQSSLLQRLPPDTVLVGAAPNLGEALGEAHRMLREQLQRHAVVNDDAVELVRLSSEYLGEEVLVAVPPKGEPVLLAETRRPGLREFLRAQASRMPAGVRVLGPENLAQATGGDLYVLVTGEIVAISPEAAALRRVLAGGGFAETEFGRRVAEAYRQGVWILLAADPSRIAPKTILSAGADNLRFLVVEQRKLPRTTESRATLNFAGARHGIAASLAPPAPMGSLDFVAPWALAAASFVVKNPATVLDDLIRLADSDRPGVRREMEQLETRLGIRLRDDLGSSLGNDLTIALHEPVLPKPSWMFAMEAHDPARIQLVLEKLFAAKKGEHGLTMKFEGEEAHVRFAEGYLVAASDPGTLNAAIRARQTNNRLVEKSGEFRSLLPRDRRANFSALVYHDFTRLAVTMTQIPGRSPAQVEAVRKLVEAAKPNLIYAYGENDRIQVASSGGFFGLTPEHALSSAGLSALLRELYPRTTR